MLEDNTKGNEQHEAKAPYNFQQLPQINTLGRQGGLYETLLSMSGGKGLLRLDEISRILGIDYKSVYKAVTTEGFPGGRLHAIRFGSTWMVSTADLAAYMTKDSNLPGSKGILEMLVEIFNPLDPEDWQLRQAIDDYIAETAKDASETYKLKTPYALAYAIAQASYLLLGEDDEDATHATSQTLPRVTRRKEKTLQSGGADKNVGTLAV